MSGSTAGNQMIFNNFHFYKIENFNRAWTKVFHFHSDHFGNSKFSNKVIFVAKN